MGREILTLQLGHRANYLATHFWNSQEANFDYEDSSEGLIIDNDVHFRSGIGEGGVETYTPRTLIYDLKGGFGNLRKYNELYYSYESEDSTNWDGGVQKYSEPSIPVNVYQAALSLGSKEDVLTTDKVRWWSDFNRVYYHPRSAIRFNQYQNDASSFQSFIQGRELFKDINKDEDILDRDVRPFAEECDSLQGFQIIMESNSAWSGFGAEYLEAIRGEYGKTTIWTWGIESDKDSAAGRLSLTRMMSSIYELTTLYIPIVQPVHLPATVTIDPSSYWHVSALYALLYDSITLPTRTRREQSYAMDMDELAARLNIHGQRKITNPKVAVLSESLRPNDIISLGWPEVIGDRPITAVVVRGWMKDVHELTGSFGQNAHISECILHPQQFPLATSFPKIFPYHLNDASISAISSLSSNPTTVISRLQNVTNDARRLAPLEERETLINTISEISSYFKDE